MRWRRMVLLSLLAVALVPARGSARDRRSPWPDPGERARFQQEELARRIRLHRWPAAEEAGRRALQDRYDVVSYRIELDLNGWPDEWLIGDVTARIVPMAAPLDSVLLDLRASMAVDSVFVDGLPATHSQRDADLLILPESPLPAARAADVRIHYQGHPVGGGSASFGWAGHNGTPLVWSLSEPEGAREWWPCKDRPDDKADSVDVILNGPDWMVSTSNGILSGVTEEPDGTKTYHWRHRYPITTYLVSVTATNYVRIHDQYVRGDGDVLPIEHFVYPENEEAAREDLSITPDAMAVLEKRFGPYPFPAEKYGHALFPWGGAMEHQTNTSYGAALIRGNHQYDWILVHELAHQWWGDMTSPADWREIWLNEGFASFSEALWFEEHGGEADYLAYMNNVQTVRDPSGPLYDPVALFDGNTVYNKGAWAVHMMRWVLGDSLFYEALAAYREQTAYRSTTTAELQAICERVSGTDLDWFFEPWIYGVDRPEYSVSFLPIDEGGLPSVAIHIDQIQTRAGFFRMPLEIEVAMEGNRTLRALFWNERDRSDLELPLPARAASVRIDPDGWVLKRVVDAAYGMNITSTDLPDGVRSVPYETRLRSRGGTQPHRWELIGGEETGLTLDPGSGLLSGTPADTGSHSFAARVIDGEGRTDEQTYRWLVLAQPPDSGGPGVRDALGLRTGPVPAREWIDFVIEAPAGSHVNLSIFDVAGRRIRTLWDGAAPSRPLSWDGRDERGEKVPSGIHLARLRSPGKGEITRRIVWIR